MGNPKTATSTNNSTSNGTATTTLSPEVKAAYDALLGQIGGGASGTNTATNAAASGLGALSSGSNPAFGQAANTLQSASTPASSSVQSYLSPYVSSQLQAQMALENQQNAQQQQGVIGNAAAQGALGGNRVGVAQGILAGQQALANNATNSGILNSAYQQALQGALQGQQNQTAIGNAQTGLGSSQTGASLDSLLGLLSAGNSQYSNLGTLAGAASGLSNSGATVSTTGQTSGTSTVPNGNIFSSLLGAGLGIAGLFKAGGVVPGYAAGGTLADLVQAANGAVTDAQRNAEALSQQQQQQQQSGAGNGLIPGITQQQAQAGAANLKGWLFPANGNIPAAANGGVIPANDNPRHYAPGGYVDFPYADFGDASGLISDAGLGVTPRLPQGMSRVDNQGLPYVAPAAASAGVVPLAKPVPVSAAVPQLRTDTQVVPVASPAQGVIPKGGMGALFAADEQAYGLPSGYLGRTAGIESSGNPNASNPSGASGLFQFMPSTAKEYGLTNPNDPAASADAAARLAAANAKTLASGLGRAPTPGELYLAHQQGAGGALGLLSHPNAPAASIVGADAVLQNGGTADMTAGQFASMWENRFNRGISDTNAPGFNTGAAGVIPNPGTGTGAPGGGIPGGYGVTPPGGFGVPDSNAGYASNIGDVFKSLQAGKGLNLSPDARMALLSAGAGMMAGTNPNAFANIGAGVQQGLQTWQDKQKLNIDTAKANNEIGYDQGTLQQAGQRLYGDLAHIQAQIANETAQTAKTNVEAAKSRFVPTPFGFMQYDPNNPSAPPKVIPYSQVTGGSQGAPSPSGAAPATDAEGFVTQAPAPTQINPLLMNPDSAKLVYGQTQTALGGAQGDAINAQALNAQLGELSNLAKNMPATGPLSQGAGFNQRVDAVKALNSTLQTMGIAPIDPQEVATAEGMKKLATQLQFSVADAVKTDPAAATIAQAASASPSGENTQAGFNRIVGNISALNKRSVDRYNFLQSWANNHYGDLTGADVAFNEANPPKAYVAYGEKLAQQLDQGTAGGGQQPNSPNPAQQMTATNPKTGERVIWSGGKWVPYNG